MGELAALNARLAEAEAAFHALSTGTQVSEVDAGGRRVRFTPANLSALLAYQADLRRQIATLSEAQPPSRRPLFVRF